MVSRRWWIGASVIALFASACAIGGRQPRMSLRLALLALTSSSTEVSVIEQWGEPAFRVKFGHDDPADHYLPNRGSISQWKHGMKSMPEDLLDSLPVGTPMLVYSFTNGIPLNPTGGLLFVCVDAKGAIIGWLYSSEMVGEEAQFFFSRQK